MKKLKLVTILGTRPEIIRLSEIIKLADRVFDHTVIHTGQNYDYQLNDIFFEDLNVRKPDFFLNVVGGNLGETIGNIISKSYDVLCKIEPEALLVLGDTNSVLSTIAAKRLKIPIFHMEAGNRCFDQNVPEEINRKISDHISDINLTYTEHSRRYLISEGFRRDHIFVTGSPLYEVLSRHGNKIANSNILKIYNLVKGEYFVLSLHREENIDLHDNFKNLMTALNQVVIKYNLPIIFSTHPRTKKRIDQLRISFNPLIKLVDPLGFFDYVSLQQNALCVLSDSGTISEESAMMNFSAVSIRTSTERPEAIDFGSIILGGILEKDILNSLETCLLTKSEDQLQVPHEYKVLDTSKRVIRVIQSYTSVVNKVIWDKR
jgi:UDP-N-acetyl-L-fucosamine synthase